MKNASSSLVPPGRQSPPLGALKVALYLDDGCRGAGCIRWAQRLRSSPDVVGDFLDAADVLAGRLAGHDILVMPGGGGYERFAQLGEAGFEKIRAFIREGGGYYGTCAGFAMALNDPKRLRLLPFTREKTPPRGRFTAAVEFNDRAASLLGIAPGTRHFYYHDGPIPAPGDPVPDAECETLATFAGEVMQSGESVSPMVGMPAAVFGRYGRGKVFATVMHPEYDPSTLDVLSGGFRALAGRDVRFPLPPRRAARPLRVAFYASEIDRLGPAAPVRAVVEDALSLLERPDADVVFVDGEDIARSALDHADALAIPGGVMDRAWPEVRPLVEAFRAAGGRVAESWRAIW